MSGYRRVNYYELCRLCTSSEGTKMHIFREEGKRKELMTKIQMCLPLQVSEEDSLPNLVCYNCIDKLESFFDFRSSCVNAEAMLESYFTSLRYNNNDFTKEGKVYVKDVPVDKSQENEGGKKLEESNLQTPAEDTPVPSQMKVSSSQQQTVTSVPLTLNSLTNLVQAAAMQIVGQNEAEKLLDSRLQQYKCALQIQQQPVQTVETSTGDSRYTNTFQTCSNSTSSQPAPKPVNSKQSFSDQKHQKVDVDEEEEEGEEELEERPEEESSEDEENEPALQPSISFSSATAGQNVLVHFGFNKEKEAVTSNTIFRTSDSVNSRGTVVQIGEFLRMKAVEIEEDISEDQSESFTCDNCGKEVSEDERSNHTQTCGGALSSSDDKNNTTYLCSICNKPFKRKEHLFQHKKLHTGERPFLCLRCGKAFSRKEHLVRHSVSHTGQKQYSCDICGKSFGRKDNVRKHRKTHGLSGPFVCETCGKTFVVKPYYLMHKASHCTDSDTNFYPYKCDVCNKGFTVKQYLMTHKLRHRNKTSGEILDQSESVNVSTVQAAPILPPNVLHQGQVFQVSSGTSTAYICTTTSTNQLLETYRKLNKT